MSHSLCTTLTILICYFFATLQMTTSAKATKNPIFKTGLVCVKTLTPFSEIHDVSYKEVKGTGNDFVVEVKGFSLFKEEEQYKLPLGLAVEVQSSMKYDFLLCIALNEYSLPVGKYFTKFMSEDKTCATHLPSTNRTQVDCDVRSDYFKNTKMFYLEKDMDLNAVAIYWSPLDDPKDSYEFIQFYFIPVNSRDKIFYTNIESDPVSLSRSKRETVKPTELQNLDEFQIHCIPLELGSYFVRLAKERHISHIDPSMYAEIFDEPFRPTSLFSTSLGDKKLYSNCFKLYGCLGDRVNCIEENSCSTLITFKAEKAPPRNPIDSIRIQILTKFPNFNFGYIAIGFSLDDKMGDDMVVECCKSPSGAMNAFLSWNNKGRTNKRIQGLECNPKSGLLTNCSFEINTVSEEFKCEFFIRDNFIYNENRFDFVFESYFLMLAIGTKLSDTQIQKHDRKFISTKKISLSTIKVPRGLIYYVHNHSSLMIAVWIVLVPNAIFLARYFKESWTKKLILGRRIYFTLHVSVMVVGFLCLLVALGYILYVTFQKRKRWSDAPEVVEHMKLGGTACLLYLIQIFSGWVRPIDEWSRRMFSIWHWIIGTVSMSLAFVNLLQSSEIQESHVPCYIPVLVIGWLVWTVLCHIAMAGWGRRLAIWFVYFVGTTVIAVVMITSIVTSNEDCNCKKKKCYV